MFPMYIVRRPFRNYGDVKVAGALVDDPATIKHFKSLVADGHIVSVTEHTLDKYEEFFNVKYKVSIKGQLKVKADAAKAAEEKAKAEVAKAAEEKAKAETEKPTEVKAPVAAVTAPKKSTAVVK